MTVKTMATHLQLENIMTVLHVEGTREEVIRSITYAAAVVNGMDLTLLLKSEKNKPYRRMKMWVGPGALMKALVSDDHEVEVSDEPISMDTVPTIGEDTLEVEL